MCKTLICALLLTLYLKSINGETCPNSAPLTVTADETEYGKTLSFSFSLNQIKWILFNKHGNGNITLGTAPESSTFRHSMDIKDLPISYYVSAIVVNSPQLCDLKLAIVFANNPSRTSRITRAMNDFKSNPCVYINNLPCKNEPTLSISYSGTEDESARRRNHTITYSEATLVHCNGPSDNHLKWYYDNDTEIVKGPAITVTKSMSGANIYCAEIATCLYGHDDIKPCTLARSKIYTLHFVMKNEPTLNLSDPCVEIGDRDYSGNNVTTIPEFRFSGYNSCLKCDGAWKSAYVAWYNENDTLVDLTTSGTILLNKSMDGLKVICRFEDCSYASVVKNKTECTAQSHAYILRFVESTPIGTEPSPSMAAAPAYVCPRLSTHSAIAKIPYEEDQLLHLHIFAPSQPYKEGHAVPLQGDKNVEIQCTPNQSQNARINIYYKKRDKADFECVDANQFRATNIYDEIVCVNIKEAVPLNRSAFVYIFNTPFTPATSTSETYDRATTSLPEGTTSLALDDTDGGPRKAQPVGLWAGIVIAGVLVLAAFVYAIYIWRKNTAKRLVLDDQIYSTSGQVQYAELRIKSGSKRIQLQEENSPYAQIIGVMAPRS